MLENPYNLHPATGKDFIGRADILAAWRERLTPESETWESAKSWMVIGAGGMGKTSLLYELVRIAKDDFKAHTISIDLGHLREVGDTGDLFDKLSIEMPIAKEPRTKLRKWFGLQPDAPLSNLVGQIAGELLNQVTGFALGLVGGDAGSGIGIGSFRQKPSELEGTAHRLAQFLVNLSILSEEQNTPVIVFLDQIGKCHDHPTWAYIAGMFLGLGKKMRSTGAGQVFFVTCLRPEQEGLLRYQIDRRLLDKDIFVPMDLYPLSFEEAINAIIVRGGGYIASNLATRIITEINSQGPLDPYTIQLSSMAVWNYLVGDNQWHSPIELEADMGKLRSILQHGHSEIIQPFMQDPTLWGLLVYLSQNRGGLTISQIHNRLGEEYNLSMGEVNSAINHLLNPPRTGYRLLTEIVGNKLSNRYILAHDLLRDYILSIIPDDERLIGQANNILEYGLWRYQEKSELLSDWELQILWEVHPYISFSLEHWDMIINSELHVGSRRLLLWQSNYPEPIALICNNSSQAYESHVPNIRLSLFSCLINSLADQSQIQLKQNAFGLNNETTRYHMTAAKDRLRRAALLVLTELAHDTDDFVRREAAGALGGLGEAALPVLTELAHDNGLVRGEVAAALGGVGQAALPVLTELAYDKNPNTRGKVAEALGGLGEAALPVLTELAYDKERNIRMRAIGALGQLGEAAVPVLTELAHDKEQNIRGKVAEALRLAGEAAVPVLTELAYDKERNIRMQAIGCLEQLGKAALGMLANSALTILIRLNQDPDPFVRINIAMALRDLGEKESALPVLTELAHHRGVFVRIEAANALGVLGEAALPVLTELTHDNYSVRGTVAAALGGVGQAALPVLTELAYDKNDYVRREAAGALGKLGEAASPVLTELAYDKNPKNRATVAAALGRLGEAALPVLTELTHDIDKYVRMNAAESLGGLGEAALPVLTELAHDKDYDVRTIAVNSVGRLGEAALSVLTELAHDENPKIRGNVAAALGGVGQAALPVLTELAYDRDRDIRMQAIGGLEQLGKAALPVLTELALNDEKEANRIEAARGLGRLGKIATQELFMIAITNPSTETRRFAAIELIKNILPNHVSDRV